MFSQSRFSNCSSDCRLAAVLPTAIRTESMSLGWRCL